MEIARIQREACYVAFCLTIIDVATCEANCESSSSSTYAYLKVANGAREQDQLAAAQGQNAFRGQTLPLPSAV